MTLIDEEIGALTRGVRAGERRAIGKAITLVESERAEDRERSARLLGELTIGTAPAFRLGVTGAPGVGKSTLVDALGLRAIADGRRVAVLAIDPSSVRSGGSLLGDRTRMGALAASPRAFIRPSPSAGAQGGIGRGTREALIVLEAAGYDVLIVETVGVGQGELAVTDVADLVLVLWMAGAGDDVQGMKRGILEHADLVAFTKADGDNLHSARAARDALHALFSLFRRDEPRVLAVSAFSEPDARGLWQALTERRAELEASGELVARRRNQRRVWFQRAIERALLERLMSEPELERERLRLGDAVERGELVAPEAARRLVDRLERRS
jgi:LAO/AO transport system kinase